VAKNEYGVLGRIRRALEGDLASETYGALFKAFSRRSPHARRFDGWSELIASLQARVAPPDVEDAVLRDLRACYLEEPGPLWHTVLTLVYFPALSSIHAKTRRWAAFPDVLWSDVHWAFLQAITKTDPSSCPAGMARKLYDNTFEGLRRLYKREWRHAEREKPSGDLDFPGNEPGSPEPGYAALEHRDEGDRALERLRALAEKGAFPRDDLDLFLATRVEGVGLEEAATARGISYQAAKKRCQRMAAAVRRLFQEP
jgi:hypothetical protein